MPENVSPAATRFIVGVDRSVDIVIDTATQTAYPFISAPNAWRAANRLNDRPELVGLFRGVPLVGGAA